MGRARGGGVQGPGGWVVWDPPPAPPPPPSSGRAELRDDNEKNAVPPPNLPKSRGATLLHKWPTMFRCLFKQKIAKTCEKLRKMGNNCEIAGNSRKSPNRHPPPPPHASCLVPRSMSGAVWTLRFAQRSVYCRASKEERPLCPVPGAVAERSGWDEPDSRGGGGGALERGCCDRAFAVGARGRRVLTWKWAANRPNGKPVAKGFAGRGPRRPTR